MSLSNSTNKNPNVLPLRLLSQKKGKVVITPSFHNQIKYLCSKINTVEWSGVLYHTSEGDLENPESFVCKPEHILLMDKGTGSYTEYDFSSPLFMDGLHDKPELMDMTPGHIHSHHNMDSFFSGTDSDELAENAVNYNYYLSLIVNNAGKYVARVAFPGKIEGRTISYINNKGVKIDIPTPDEDVIFYYEMEIIIQQESLVDKVKRKFLSKYNRILGNSLEDAIDVIEIAADKTETFDVEKCFEDQYNRVISSKPVVTYQNNWQNRYNENFNHSSRQTKSNQTSIQFTPSYKDDDKNLILRFASINYIRSLCESATFGVEFYELSNDLKKPLSEFLIERNGWVATRDYEKDLVELINSEVDYNRFIERYMDSLLMDDAYDYSDFDIAKINQEAIDVLEEPSFKNYAVSKILVKNLGLWTWE